MPGMDGIAVCNKIRESEGSRYTYIVMVTSKEDTRDIVTGMSAGADDFISRKWEDE
ncbi:MAG: response regulator [Thermodesulfobacteriota bacterium]|nr:response regulator [Thermodesulfobacteriota bacterium]